MNNNMHIGTMENKQSNIERGWYKVIITNATNISLFSLSFCPLFFMRSDACEVTSFGKPKRKQKLRK